ncbi:hypothetical protein [Streptomyces sp. 135]|uniref:hypothetical protein n=1 Tax=Streptomyces sp. 135 TaxID=2838850 RepID=UPI0021D9A985|nr:hypothetical protein [Streptomyces sp. 135]
MAASTHLAKMLNARAVQSLVFFQLIAFFMGDGIADGRVDAACEVASTVVTVLEVSPRRQRSGADADARWWEHWWKRRQKSFASEDPSVRALPVPER